MTYTEWTAADSAQMIRVPEASDDKYSRGVLGVMTGSEQYPGAAVLGVEAALHTGVGMLRYVGPDRVADFILARRPEVVASTGRVQAWLLGSGMDAASRGQEATDLLRDALAQGLPTVLDAGALDLVGEARGPVVITPHSGELARMLDTDRGEVAADPGHWAETAAERFGVTVLLKGASTRIADAAGSRHTVGSSVAWTATAGAGDALGGILGALVATGGAAITADPTALARLAATAAVLHGLAAASASGGGPFTILELTTRLPAAVVEVLAAG